MLMQLYDQNTCWLLPVIALVVDCTVQTVRHMLQLLSKHMWRAPCTAPDVILCQGQSIRQLHSKELV